MTRAGMDRTDPPYVAGERDMYISYLEYHRATLGLKTAGLTDEELRRRSVPPSSLSLLGLVRHMAEVERSWFRRAFAGEDAPPRYFSDANPDGDFDDVDTADIDEAFEFWASECAHARELVADAPDLDATGIRHGEVVTLRWILHHMVEEYARHNGHADLIRERIDGATGE